MSQPLISSEEFDIPFVPFPLPFLVLMMVPPCDDNKVAKISHQILIHLLILLTLFMIQIH